MEQFARWDDLITFSKGRVTLAKKARKIKVFAFDFDGVFTDNGDYICADPQVVFKKRSHTDGQGISLLRALGMKIIIVTGEREQYAQPAVNLVGKWNSLDSVASGAWSRIPLEVGANREQKAELIEKWLGHFNCTWSECCVMGDDLTEVKAMEFAGFTAAPASADIIIKNMVDIVSRRPAGDGAVRDIVNFFLLLKGIDPRSLALR
jgi:3-deoxy-D-manno-octulosonate 8-phosphate phosphatase (KDO 8-P phosphatase)